MNIRRTMKLTACFAFVTLAATACTQAVDDGTGASASAVGGGTSGASATDEAGRPLRPRFLLADVVDHDGAHALVPFVLPEPPKDAPPPGGDVTGEGAPKPPPCLVHRTTEGEPAPMPPPPPKDGDPKPGPVMLQIAVFASEADATAGPPKEGVAPTRPVVVVQCFAAPGEKRVDVPKAVLDDAFAGLVDGATARIALAGFPMPPPPPKDGDALPPPPPPMGRGLFGVARVADTGAIDALLTGLTLP